MPQFSSPTHCVFCGVSACEAQPDALPMRQGTICELRAFLFSWCIPTTWHFEALKKICENAESHPDSAFSMCKLCFQWRRRTGVRRSMTKCFTPFDSVLLYLLTPGEVDKPDQRSLQRLLNALGSTGNQFQGLLPHPVQLILTEVVGIVDTDLEDAIFLAWWKTNEEPLFFRSGATAKCLRRLFKRQRRGSL